MNIPTIKEVLSDPSSSYWLKNASRSAEVRDAVDAMNDAEMLVRILGKALNFTTEAEGAAAEAVRKSENRLRLAREDANVYARCYEEADDRHWLANGKLLWIKNYTFGLQAAMLEGRKVSMQQLAAIERKAEEAVE